MEHIGQALGNLNPATNIKTLNSTDKPTTKGKKWEPSSGHIADHQDRLEKYGYAPNPYCQVCRGAGFIHPHLPSGKPDYSRVIQCPAKNCIKDSYAAHQRGESHLRAIGVSSKGQTFDSFKLVPGVKETYSAFKKLATGDADYSMLLCYGGVGNGKTHLCNALGIELNHRGIDARLFTVSDMISQLKESISSHTTEAVIRELKTVPALILDDFKVEYSSIWEMERIEEIIDARYRENLITVLVTNRDLDEIPERILSRFYEPGLSKVVLNKGKDYRRR